MIITTEKPYPNESFSGTCNRRPESKTLSKGNQGFTLIEVLIAIFILSIGIFAVGKLQTTAIEGDFKADNLTRSCSMAANKAEQLLKMDFTDEENLDPGQHGPDSSCKQFCIGWEVTQKVPLMPVTEDTDGTSLATYDGDSGSLTSIGQYMAKTIDIVVFTNAQGFDGTNNQRFKITIVKPRFF